MTTKLYTAHEYAHLLSIAVRNERERCAKIAEQMRPAGGRAWDEAQAACFAALTDCAHAIRNPLIEPR